MQVEITFVSEIRGDGRLGPPGRGGRRGRHDGRGQLVLVRILRLLLLSLDHLLSGVAAVPVDALLAETGRPLALLALALLKQMYLGLHVHM